MNSFPTHYDILMVSKNTSPEVIRAAFKSLSQKYHPDKSNHPDADRIMQEFNESYAVLSDPVERSKYDELLCRYEHMYNDNIERDYSNKADNNSKNRERRNKVVVINIPDSLSISNAKIYLSNFLAQTIPIVIKILKYLFYIAILLFLMSMLFTYIYDSDSYNAADDLAEAQREIGDAARELSEAAAEYDDYENYPPISDSSESLPVYNNLSQEPSTSYKTHAPNGELYPSSAGYVAGYPQLNNDGASVLTIDNSQNSEAVFGKLYYLDSLQPQAVRYFYIQGGGGLNIRNISAGNYDVRYKDLEQGYISKSEPMLVQEYEDAYGSRFSEITMTLYKVSNGNMQTYSIPESEF